MAAHFHSSGHIRRRSWHIAIASRLLRSDREHGQQNASDQQKGA
jgi:hypothetical protein